MHISPLLISSFLLAPAVLAVPREFRRSLLDLVEKRTEIATLQSAGAGLQDGATFSHVFGTLTLPTSLPDQGSAGIAQIGIDGLDACNATFQIGIRFQYTDSGLAYDAYYEWYPFVAPQPFADSDIISPGDIIDIGVMAPTNKTYGVVIFKNRNTTWSFWQDMHSNDALCLGSARWMVQIYDDASPNFGSIVFNASAIKTGGDLYSPQGATTYNIQQNGKNLTSVEVNENSVNITYTG